MENIYNIDDINNITESDLRELFDNIELANNNSENSDQEDICPTCNSKDKLVEDFAQGFIVCKECGQVIDTLIDNNPEWHDDEKGNTSRCSMPINKLLPQSSLGTTISGGSYRNRIKTLHGWSAMPYKERSLNLVFKEIQSKCQQAGIIKCIEDDAKILYKSISECKHIKGKNKDKCIIIRGANRKSLIAACVFYACKKKSMTRSPKEISDLFNIKYTEMTKGCKNFGKLIKLKIGGTVNVSLPEHFINRFCNELKIKRIYMEESSRIASNISKLNIASDHTPFSIATGSILLMAENNGLTSITKKKIAEKFGVSEVTITKTYNKLWKYRHILLSNEITDTIIKENNNRNIDIVPLEIQERMKKFGVTEKSIKNINVEEILNNNIIVPDNNINDNNYDLKKQLDLNLANIYSKLDIILLNNKNICMKFYSDYDKI